MFKTPGFTAVAIITVALAIGANTAVFSLVNALLIRPLPFKAPQDLILLFEKFSGQGLDQIPVSAPEYLEPRAWLLLEHGHEQSSAVQRLLSEARFLAVESTRDLAGILRVTGGQRTR